MSAASARLSRSSQDAWEATLDRLTGGAIVFSDGSVSLIGDINFADLPRVAAALAGIYNGAEPPPIPGGPPGPEEPEESEEEPT